MNSPDLQRLFNEIKSKISPEQKEKSSREMTGLFKKNLEASEEVSQSENL